MTTKAGQNNCKTSKASRLRELIESRELSVIMEAHNGISARVVEEAGFQGIWGSGLALSAQFGVRDNNEASWTQIVDMLEFMCDATSIPILLDGDTGYGNFNNVQRLVKKLEQRGVAGVCIEDKIFPKTNSFIGGEQQPLADMDEFCGKIKAGKDIQSDPDFCIVARVEALIAGWDLAEALRRAEAYAAAGADAILIHSKLSKPDQILAFAKEWANRKPLVIVPTKYYSTPIDVYKHADISLVIWANHMIRAAVAGMQSAAEEIFRDLSTVNVEDPIASVGELFRLQGAEELQQTERLYFSDARKSTRAIVLAASRGRELATLTEQRPKVMLPIGGKPLLERLKDEFKRQSINDITVVAGYKAEAIDLPGIAVRVNKDFETTGELASLATAKSDFQDDMLIIYGDLLFRSYVLNDLLEASGDIVAVIDSAESEYVISGTPDYAYCSAPDDRAVLGAEVSLLQISDEASQDRGEANGRWIGMLKVAGRGRKLLEQTLTTLEANSDYEDLGIPDLLNYLVEQGHKVQVVYIHGHWLDVNSLDDLDRAGDFTSSGPK